MGNLLLIFILLIIVLIVGDQTIVRVLGCLGILLLLLNYSLMMTPVASEPFTVVQPRAPGVYGNQEYDHAPYDDYVTYNPKLRAAYHNEQYVSRHGPIDGTMDDRLMSKQLHTGRQATTVNRGMGKNRIDYARPFYEESLNYNEGLEWWNEDRTYYGDSAYL